MSHKCNDANYSLGTNVAKLRQNDKAFYFIYLTYIYSPTNFAISIIEQRIKFGENCILNKSENGCNNYNPGNLGVGISDSETSSSSEYDDNSESEASDLKLLLEMMFSLFYELQTLCNNILQLLVKLAYFYQILHIFVKFHATQPYLVCQMIDIFKENNFYVQQFLIRSCFHIENKYLPSKHSK